LLLQAAQVGAVVQDARLSLDSLMVLEEAEQVVMHMRQLQ
jgi:hypothetical protein